jgi:DNA-binding NarL/FixJ family response regulator
MASKQTYQVLSLLVVDDHRYFRESLVSFLAEIPAVRVSGIAENGREAVALAAVSNPNVIIMDIQMPGMNGIEACRIIKERMPQAKIILYTMHGAEHFSKTGLECADWFLPKDRLFEELPAVLSAVVGGNKHEQGTYRCSQ